MGLVSSYRFNDGPRGLFWAMRLGTRLTASVRPVAQQMLAEGLRGEYSEQVCEGCTLKIIIGEADDGSHFGKSRSQRVREKVGDWLMGFLPEWERV